MRMIILYAKTAITFLCNNVTTTLHYGDDVMKYETKHKNSTHIQWAIFDNYILLMSLFRARRICSNLACFKSQVSLLLVPNHGQWSQAIVINRAIVRLSELKN